MEETIKMSIINKDGKKITKDIPKDLYSLYEKIGWKKDVEPKKEPTKNYFSKKNNGLNNKE